MEFSLFLLKYQLLNLKIYSQYHLQATCDMKQCETHFKDIFSKNGKNLKNIILAANFNINLLVFGTNKKVQRLFKSPVSL